ncbi:MAG: hypothetical protein RSF40_00790 [Oscillospiraceae bacterium]
MYISKSERNLHKKKALLVSIIGVLVIFVSIGLILVLTPQKADAKQNKFDGIEIDLACKKIETENPPTDFESEKSFDYRFNSEPVFQKSNLSGELMLVNPSYNEYFMTVEITNENDDLMYYSKPIPSGYCIDKVKLVNDFETGTYQATINISAVDKESLEVIESKNENITITIK